MAKSRDATDSCRTSSIVFTCSTAAVGIDRVQLAPDQRGERAGDRTGVWRIRCLENARCCQRGK